MKMTKITTDTATIAVFDLCALEHKIDADGDWWTYDQSEELQAEIQNGNLYLINTGFDGSFEVMVDSELPQVHSKPINSPSKELYIVCGEELPAEGLTPELLRGGIRYHVDASEVHISHDQVGSRITIHIKA
ncbi:MAG: DUF6386 family protein [Geobacteraceae bacterium]|nr:DUF6386 family protein [Geobacteraceae bacterium]